MSDKIKILGIAGSLRKGSLNKALLREAVKLAPENIEIEIADISEIPLYNGDIEVQGTPEAVKVLKDKIRNADALIIVTPEYNYSVPGVLKNAIDWVSRPVTDSPLNNKPLGIMGAGGMSGTIRAQLHLRQVAIFTNMIDMKRPEVLVQKASEKFDNEGNLIDQPTIQQVKKFLNAFVAWINRVSIKK